MSNALLRLRGATADSIYGHKLWLVGGAVRDELLGKPVPNDLDLVLEGDALQLAHFLREQGASDIEPVVYPRFGTALIRLDETDIELVTARRESYDDASRKPEVEPATLEQDAMRRDFTVNTLLRNLQTGELRDPLGTGLADLQAKILRTPLDPAATFYDDPLRMLRAVRFVHQLGFAPAPELYESVRQERERLKIISSERIRDEFSKMLAAPTASAALRDLVSTGLLQQFAPELVAMQGVEQGSYHHLDVWDHTLLVIDQLQPWIAGFTTERRLMLSLSGLLHDVGKPSTRFVDEEGQTRFFGHENVGAEMSERFLRRLKFAGDTIDPVVLMVRHHMRLGSMPQFTASAARRVVRDLGENVEDLLLVVEADARSLRPGVRALDLAPVRAKIEQVKRATPASTLNSPLSGAEIMEITGLSPGPQVGKVKQMLTEKVLDGELAPGDVEGARAILGATKPNTADG